MDYLSHLLGRQWPQQPQRTNEFSLYWSRGGVLLVGFDKCGLPIKRTIIPLDTARHLDERLVGVKYVARFNSQRGRWDFGWQGVDHVTGATVTLTGGMALAFRLGLECRPEREPSGGFGDPSDLLAEEQEASSLPVTLDGGREHTVEDI